MLNALRAETLKFRGSPLALSLTAAALLLPALLWGLERFGPEGLSVTGQVAPWQLVAHAVVALLLPYLLTLEAALGTEKWVRVTPTPPGAVLASKVAVALGLAALGGLLAALLLPGPVTLAGAAGVLSSALVIAVVAVLTRHLAATLLLGVVWLQLGPALVSALPPALQGPVGALLPGVALTHWADGPHLWPRLLGHAALLALLLWRLRRDRPAW